MPETMCQPVLHLLNSRQVVSLPIRREIPRHRSTHISRHRPQEFVALGEGDFSQPVTADVTAPHNELDALAHHLNALCPQIKQTLHLSQQLAVQAERNRIARELHDSVKQQLFTLRIHLVTAEALSGTNAPVTPHLTQSIDPAENTQEEVRALIQMFHQNSRTVEQ